MVVERVPVRCLGGSAKFNCDTLRKSRQKAFERLNDVILNLRFVGRPVYNSVVINFGQLLYDGNLSARGRQAGIESSWQENLEGAGGNGFRVPRTPVITFRLPQFVESD